MRYTPEQLAQIGDVSNSATYQNNLRDKFKSTKEKETPLSMDSISKFEDSLNKSSLSVENVAKRLVKGFENMLKIPKTVNTVLEEVAIEFKDTTSQFKTEVNSLTKSTLSLIRANGIQSKQVKQQNENIAKASNSINDITHKFDILSNLTDQLRNAEERKLKLEESKQKAGANVPSALQQQININQKEISDVSTAMLGIRKRINDNTEKAMSEIHDAITDNPALKDGLEDHLKVLNTIKNSVGTTDPLTEDMAKDLEVLVQLLSVPLKVTDVAAQNLHKSFGEKVDKLSTAIKVGAVMAYNTAVKYSNAVSAQLATGIESGGLDNGVLGNEGAGGKLTTAMLLGMSPQDYYALLKTNRTSVSMLGGDENIGKTADRTALMDALREGAFTFGLVGADALKFQLRNIGSQLSMGTYDRGMSPEQRVSMANNMSARLKSDAVSMNMDPNQYAEDYFSEMDSGLWSPLIERLRDQGLSGEKLQDATLLQIKEIKKNNQQLGYSNDYYKQMLAESMRARNKGLEEMITGQMGVQMTMSLAENMGAKFTQDQRDAVSLVQQVGGIDNVAIERQDWARENLASAQVEYNRVISENMTKQGKQANGMAALSAGGMQLGLMNTISDRVSGSAHALLTGEGVKQSLRGETIDNATIKDANGNIISSPVQTIDKDLLDASKNVSAFDKAIIKATTALGAIGDNPFGGAAMGALGFAANGILGGLAQGYVASKFFPRAPVELPDAKPRGRRLSRRGKGVIGVGLALATTLGLGALMSGDAEAAEPTQPIEPSSSQTGYDSKGQYDYSYAREGNKEVQGAYLASSLLGRVGAPLAAITSTYMAYEEVADDPRLSKTDKTLHIAGTAAGAGLGGWGGTAAGAAIGTAILPGIGTVVGGILGGYFGANLGADIGQSAGHEIAGAMKEENANQEPIEILWMNNDGTFSGEAPSTIQWMDDKGNFAPEKVAMPSTTLNSFDTKIEQERLAQEQKQKDTEDSSPFSMLSPSEIADFVRNVGGIIGNIGGSVKDAAAILKDQQAKIDQDRATLNMDRQKMATDTQSKVSSRTSTNRARASSR